MKLLIPEFGLIFWQALVFLSLMFLLMKYAWKPIIASLKIREESIQSALDSAEKAKEEMANLKSENEKLLHEARTERDKILKDAQNVANKLRDQAREDAVKTGNKLIEDAKATIETEKKAALAEVRTQVADLSLQIAEKLLRKNLSADSAQKELVSDFMKDLKIN